MSTTTDSYSTGAGTLTDGVPGKRVWRDRNFNLFWAGQTFDAFGDAAAMIILPLLVLEATGSVAQMGLISGTAGFTCLVTSLASGVIVDRVNRRRLMIYCDIGRAIAYVSLPAVWWFSGASILPIYALTVLAATLGTLFVVAYTTIVPNVVEKEHISDANGMLQTTAAAAYVAGPMIAGFASHNLSPAMAVVMVGISYIASALMMLFVRLRSKAASARAAAPDEGRSRLDEFWAGMRFLLRHSVLRSVTLIVAGFVLISSATVDLSIFRLKNEMDQSGSTVGLVFGIASIGSILGGVLTSALRRRLGFGLCFLGSLLFQGLAVAMIGVVPSVALIALLATAFTFAYTIRGVCVQSLRQQVTPDHLLGRVTSALWTLILALGPIGTTAGTALAERVGTRPVLIANGLICICIAAAGFLTHAYTERPENEQLAIDALAAGTAES
ncbi:MAG TPA: MFS transporter [Blastocatellia bacterium]|nr:MFS transporter [Blastocatellia bacterium]